MAALTDHTSRTVAGVGMKTTAERYWFDRGIADAARDRAPIFFRKGTKVYAEGDYPAENDTQESEAGEMYLRGYEGAR